MTRRIVLASTSSYRAAILRNAGLEFDAQASEIDERAVEAALEKSSATPDDLAAVLAEAKAIAVSETEADAVVIGCDQVLSLEGQVLHKCRTMEDARRRLLQLSGKTHHLNTAVAIAIGGETVWRHVEICAMTMRELDPGFVGRHLAAVGDDILNSVGAYHYEGQGIQLFDRIDGDYFSIVGLPLLALLHELRELGAIDG